MAPVDLKSSPYFDDYNADKKFYRILYRPGFAVQARELTQAQTIYQDQIKRFGDHVFAEGSMVIPGQAKHDTNANFVKVTSNSYTDTEAAILSNFLGKVLVGGTTGIKATVLHYIPKDSFNTVYFYVKYISGSPSDPTKKVFDDGEVLTVEATAITATALGVSATGKGTLATINPGVYYTKGFFAVVDQQVIVVDAENSDPTVRIGLQVESSIVTPEDDETLLDNAAGSPNFAAPGAHRLKIELVLTAKDISTIGDPTEEDDFIELLRLRDGLLERRIDTTTYAVLNKTLARRTFDESGNYTVRPFPLEVREFLNEDSNNGVYLPEQFLYNTQSEAAAVARERFGFVGLDADITHPTLGKFQPGADDDEFLEAARAKFVYSVQPGKAYVRGYEIETIAATYVDGDKARATQTQSDQVVRVNLGNFIRVTNLFGAPRVGTDQTFGDESYIEIELRDRFTSTPGSVAGSVIGTARGIFFQFDRGTPNTSEARYNLHLFDISLNPGKDFSEVKQVAQAAQGSFLPAPYSFTADIVPIEEPFFGARVSKGVGTSNVLLKGTGVYWNTTDEQRLGIGNTLRVVDPATNDVHYMYVKAAPINNNEVVVDSTVNAAFTDASVERVYALLESAKTSSLIFFLPQAYAKTLSNLVYASQKQYISNAIAGGEVTIASSSPTDVFDAYNGTNYYFSLEDGTPLTLQQSQVSFPAATQIKLSGLAAYNGLKVVFIAAIRKTTPSPKTKTKQIGAWINRAESTASDLNLNRFYLGKADVLSIKEIRMSPDFATAVSVTDPLITDRFTLDNGQRDIYYDISSVVLKKGAQPPTGRIAVVFDWFDHGNEGTFFSVDSYVGIPYEEIPVYTNSENSYHLPLSDVLDFRPTIDSTRENFDTSNGRMSFPPINSITFDIEYYLHRRDKLYLSEEAEFEVRNGVSSLDPSYPEDPANGMVLYDVDVRAYTRNTKEIFPNMRDNKRYTMRDIGRLERRIENIEYYTSLSLLEKEAADLDIKDGSGNDRFKNGFIVDAFTGHGIGDSSSLDYKCSIDQKLQLVRPTFTEEQIPMIEVSGADGFTLVTDITRNAAGYVKKSDLLMLEYTETPAVIQKAASKFINVNPHQVFNFLGAIKLVPPLDEWKDTKLLPVAIVDQEGNFEEISRQAEAHGVIWRDWENLPGTQVVDRKEDIETINEVFPGPSFHLINGVPDANWGNQSLEQLKKINNEPETREELQRLNRILTQLRGKLKSEDDREDKRDIQKRIKEISERIGNTKEKLPSEVPPVNTFPVRTVTTTKTITSVSTSQSRQGIRATAVPKTITTSLGEKVVDISQASWIRSRDVEFEGKLFKPFTQLYPFFDSIDVEASVKPDGGNYGDPLITDATGYIKGIFTIPEGAFKTGQRIFKLTDSEINDSTATSEGFAIYRAQGLIESRQETILSTRNAELIFDTVKDFRVVTDSSFDVDVKTSAWTDPVAQSFLVDNNEGYFVTAIDVFFATKDADIPVTLEIREMVNGYPGSKVLPFSRTVLEPADVHTNVVTGAHAPTPDDPTDTVGTLSIDDGAAIANFTSSDFVATRFEFEAPVYLLGGTEYCFVVMANSVKYNLWVSEVGARNVGTRLPITGQPYAGVLFTSQNASTWSADQSADVMFNVHKAQFTTDSTKTILFADDELELHALDAGPFKTRQGSNLVKVTHRDHGFRSRTDLGNNPRVRFSGVVGPIGGLADTLFNNDFNDADDYHEVNVLDLDHYYIEMTSAATETVYGAGGDAVLASHDQQMDVMVPIISHISLPETQLTFEYKATSGDGVHDGDFDPYVLESSFKNFAAGETVQFDAPKMVCSSVNEVDATVGPVINAGFVNGSKSLFLRASLTSFNPNLSPVIDLARLNVLAIGNRIDDPEVEGTDPSVIEPLDYQHLGEKQITGTVDVLAGSADIDGTGTSFTTQLHVGAWILIGDQLRQIDTISSNILATVTENFDTNETGVTARTSANVVYELGSSTVPVITTSLLEFDAGTKSIFIHGAATDSERTAINLLSEIKPGDLIKFPGANSDGGRVIRTSVGPDSIDIYFASSADIDVLDTLTSVTLERVIDAIICSDATISNDLAKLVQIGKYVQIKNSLKNDGLHKITGHYHDTVGGTYEIYVAYDIDDEPNGRLITLSILDGYIDEESNVGGSSASKYVSRRMLIQNPSTALRINFLANVPEGSRLKIYYKISRVDEKTPFEDIIYTEARFDSEILKAKSSNEFKEHQLTVDKLPPFLSASVKIVMLSSNSCKVPRVKDLALIALDY